MPYLIISFSGRTAIASEFVIPVLSTAEQSSQPNTNDEEESPHHAPQGLPRRGNLGKMPLSTSVKRKIFMS